MLMLALWPALAWTPDDGERALVRALSSRDGAPPCEQLEALVSDPSTSLRRIVEHVEMPPWAPMHAAACLIERHAGEHEALLEAWVADPSRKGLARLVFHRMHLLAPAQTRALTERALAGPLAGDARAAMLTSPDPEVRERAAR